MTSSTSGVDSYAEEVCEGLNEFITSEDLEVIITAITPESEDTTRVTLSLVPMGEDLSDVEYSSPSHEYTVEVDGEEVTFACQDEQHIHIISSTPDWSAFDVTDHTGEAISCAMESGL